MSGLLAGRRILLGVGGGIAAYKACELLRLLMKQGAQVQAVLSPRAASFVSPLTFAALSGQPCYGDEFTPAAGSSGDVYAHLDLTRGIDAFVIAPASADILGKLAHGIADNLLQTCALSNTAPLIIAPAMNVRMWQSSAVRDNAALLRSRGCLFVGPESGELACGDEGEGRLATPETILSAVCELFAAQPGQSAGTPASGGPLSGKRVVVCGGATREYLDPVRFITNASSGRLAIETAQALIGLGAEVDFVHTGLDLPAELATTLSSQAEGRTAFDLQMQLSRALPQANALVMLAAVADYAPVQYQSSKRKKDGAAWQLELHETPDVLGSLKSLRRPQQLVVGVSLEDTDWLRRGMEKAGRKGMDACLAVELGPDLPFGERRMRCALVGPQGILAPEELRSKPQAASLIAGWLAAGLSTAAGEHTQSPGTQTSGSPDKEN